MVDYIIETRKRFGKQTAVNSLDMKIEKGKIYGLLGKNGAGKTTTMCMLLNLSKTNKWRDIFLWKTLQTRSIRCLLKNRINYRNTRFL
ncbi:ATP-binding cassette domain-containing protein [Methanobrevibacter sp.]|uniref:ATP-binding cassette domain-containing protein n=1 Tax=Methanobrevibacter sp. TaxID=66852 RepID=UPI003F7346F4